MLSTTRIAVIVLLGLFLAASAAAQMTPMPLDTLRGSVASRLVAGEATVTRSVDVITRAEIEKLPVRNASDIIARALGVDLQMRSPAQADLSIRGSSFEQVLVLVDGVPVNDDQTGHFHLDVAVPLEAIERVEVLRGPAAAVYGSAAIGGVVNIVTTRTTRLTARAQGGSFGTFAGGGAVGTSLGRASLQLSADHDQSDGHRAGTDHKITQGRLTLAAPIAGGTLLGDVAYAARDFGANAFYAPAMFNAYEETRTGTASLGWTSAPSKLTFAPRLSFRNHDDDFILRRENPAFYHNEHTTRALSGEVVARYTPSLTTRLAFGIDGTHTELYSNSLGNRGESRAAVFSELAVGEISDGLFSLGLRLDSHSTFGTFLSPSAAGGAQLGEYVRVRASAGTGFRAPTWTERYYVDPANIGNPDLDAERFWTAELGAAISPVDDADIDVAVFVRRADGMIDWGKPEGAAPTAPWRTANIDEATFRGVEATARYSLSRVALTGRAMALGLTADEAESQVSKYALRPLSRSFSLEASVPVTGAFTVSLRGAHQKRRDGDSWETLDGRVTAARNGIEVFVDARNVLDEEYLDVSNVAAPGRAFSIGGRIRR
jgi:vitamin B12 transporter